MRVEGPHSSSADLLLRELLLDVVDRVVLLAGQDHLGDNVSDHIDPVDVQDLEAAQEDSLDVAERLHIRAGMLHHCEHMVDV